MLAGSSDHDDVFPDLLTYDSVVYELKSDQPVVKVSKDGNEEWIPLVKKKRKRTYKWKENESKAVSVSDDSGDELKMKFAREVRYRPEDPKKQHNAVMEVDTYSSKPYCKHYKI